MFNLKLRQIFSSLEGQTAILFQYHRWDNTLFLQTHINSTGKTYLVFKNCVYFELKTALILDEVTVNPEENNTILQDRHGKTIVKYSDLEVWNDDQFRAYSRNLYKKITDEKRYGIRKPITCIEELYKEK